MMNELKPFLKEVAENVMAHISSGPVQVIFPNRRAGLFFGRCLAELTDRPIWAPGILSIEDFICNHATLIQADRLTLVFELYHIYQQLNPVQESFDQFYYWGEMLLQDFDEVDKYLVDPAKIFTDLRFQKEIDQKIDYLSESQKQVITQFWQSFGDKLSGQQQDFIRIWSILYELYTRFNQQLQEKGLAYQGMVYRNAAENISQTPLYPGVTIFAGFNALNGAEEKIIKYYLQEQNAQMFWDLDAYYIDADYHEAGTFFRKYRNDKILGPTFPDPLPQNLNVKENHRVVVNGVSSDTGQVKQLGNTLRKLKAEPGWDPAKTVVVLPDEQLLFPLLNAIPAEIDQFNVTMGYPLKSTTIYDFLELLILLQLNLKEEPELKFYYKQAQLVLKHPYFYPFHAVRANEILSQMQSQNQVYLSKEDLSFEKTSYPVIFKKLDHLPQLFEYLFSVLQFLGNQSDSRLSPMEQEFIYYFYTQLKRLEEIMNEQRVPVQFKTFLKLFRQIVSSYRVPFSGEPLEGLQVMGVLETRNLDFENVFILSFNEGKFPAVSLPHSFIPYNLRKGYGLPTYDQQDGIYGYMFYRLLQKSKNVYIYYHTGQESGNRGEISRFLTQLSFESNLQIQKNVVSNNIQVSKEFPLSIEKTASVLRQMEVFVQKPGKDSARLTPSALNIYLDCRLKYYFRYVAKLYEPDQISEEVDPMIFGKLLHNTMEQVYIRFMQSKGSNLIAKQDIPQLKKLIQPALLTAFQQEFGGRIKQDFQPSGRNLLVFEIISKYVDQIIKKDQDYAPFEILGLEEDGSKNYHLDIEFPTAEGPKVIGFRGIIDRIDAKAGSTRIIDYKTGKDDKQVADIPSLFDREHPKRNKAALQTLLYSLIYQENAASASQIVPGVYNARDLFKADFEVYLQMKDPATRKYHPILDAKPLFPEFKQELTRLVAEIYDPTIHFDQTEDRRKCNYCPYQAICHRD
ncbi:MAG: PD-(D/E)XK nuclease family protein [Candidatus Cyclobacteriaceae bacterium M3_2C_046]